MKILYLFISVFYVQCSLFCQNATCDSIKIDSTYYTFLSVSESYFNKVNYIYPESKDTLRLNRSVVSITTDSITLSFLNGKTTVLKNDTTYGEPYTKYIYCKTLAKLNLVHIKMYVWEGTGDYLYRIRDGQITELHGDPLFSPNRKYLVSIYYDCYENNSYMRLMKVNKDSTELVFDIEIPSTEIDKIKWSTDSTIVIHRNIYDVPSCSSGYAEIKIIK